MTAPKDRFWAKVLFKEFIRHYRKMNDEQIVEDVKQSMDDLDDLNEDGESFGSKMVKWSTERKNQYPQAAENGAKGGRPKSSDSRSLQQKTGSVTNRHLRCPTTKEEFRQFVYDQDLNISLSEDWYAIHEARDWTDNEGGPLKNWKGALTNYCRSRENQLRGNHDERN